MENQVDFSGGEIEKSVGKSKNVALTFFGIIGVATMFFAIRDFLFCRGETCGVLTLFFLPPFATSFIIFLTVRARKRKLSNFGSVLSLTLLSLACLVLFLFFLVCFVLFL